jgi:L-ascorbate metabolism protein UlaG (beta-lactamase superfamily)
MLLDVIDWMGHAGFHLTVGRSHVYIDPYRVPDGAPQADLILITHGHYDHFSPQDVERLTKRETWLVGPAAVAERVSGQVHRIGPGRCSTTSSCAASTFAPSRRTTRRSGTPTGSRFIRVMRDGWDTR